MLSKHELLVLIGLNLGPSDGVIAKEKLFFFFFLTDILNIHLERLEESCHQEGEPALPDSFMNPA